MRSSSSTLSPGDPSAAVAFLLLLRASRYFIFFCFCLVSAKPVFSGQSPKFLRSVRHTTGISYTTAPKQPPCRLTEPVDLKKLWRLTSGTHVLVSAVKGQPHCLSRSRALCLTNWSTISYSLAWKTRARICPPFLRAVLPERVHLNRMLSCQSR